MPSWKMGMDLGLVGSGESSNLGDSPTKVRGLMVPVNPRSIPKLIVALVPKTGTMTAHIDALGYGLIRRQTLKAAAEVGG